MTSIGTTIIMRKMLLINQNVHINFSDEKSEGDGMNESEKNCISQKMSSTKVFKHVL